MVHWARQHFKDHKWKDMLLVILLLESKYINIIRHNVLGVISKIPVSGVVRL